jgi:bifunctional NMN adenylyltransferase/nudix hydrolase
MSTEKTAVVIGRWQMPHKGHNTLIRAAFDNFDSVSIVIGSAFHARDTINPFTWEERREMILCTLSDDEKKRANFIPVRDFYNDARWNAEVQKGVGANRNVTLIGFEKDETSYYINNFPNWGKLVVERQIEIDATSLRNIYFGKSGITTSLAVMKPFVEESVIEYLSAWSNLPAYRQRVIEHQAVETYKTQWPNIGLTADAIIVVDDHVLLVRRAGAIGYGLWALPGGFVNPGEHFYAAALREAEEETAFKLLDSTMRAALKGQATFNHPRRSARARLVSEGFYFNLGHMRRPEVRCKDGEALDVKWWHKSELHKISDQMFEDHLNILEKFDLVAL